MRFQFLIPVVLGSTLLAAYACGSDATIAPLSSSDGGLTPNADASTAGAGGSGNQSDSGSTPLGGGGNGTADAAVAPDGSAQDAGDNDAALGPGLVDGDGYGVVYSAETSIGIDSRDDCSATFDEDGNL